jgi:ribulose-5-phosphate 4-epimerase/fuculose-1-phosphate aldolase
MHNHPRYGTVCSDTREVPPALDQRACLGVGELVLVEEYAGSVNSSGAAAQTGAALGDSDLALLAGPQKPMKTFSGPGVREVLTR